MYKMMRKSVDNTYWLFHDIKELSFILRVMIASWLYFFLIFNLQKYILYYEVIYLGNFLQNNTRYYRNRGLYRCPD